MEYLKKELNKLLPLALLFGAVGGVLLIILGNVFFSEQWSYLLTYILVIGLSVYLLNRMRFKKEIMSSVIYGYAVFFVMTLIAWVDMVLNADPNFISPVFEQISFFAALVVSVFLIAASIATLFKRRVLM
ncbi:MAG: hypothetical protein IPO32_02570 [Crocinitomicaceae bacterium]|jgi:hypothetical protein|nr:hypothetical protein [Crocinitomicaceae bacterium]MBK9590415.1 hypothetical protein [Crocinitomicaceae bacterium]